MLLGEEYRVAECGMNARTASFDDPFRDYLNGCGKTGRFADYQVQDKPRILVISLTVLHEKLTENFLGMR